MSRSIFARISGAGPERLSLAALILVALTAHTFNFAAEHNPADQRLSAYFQSETTTLERACLDPIRTLADWNSKRGEFRRQLFEMLGLDPAPPRTDLHPVVTGRIDRELFYVEKIHFQSLPGLYVTANLYIPKTLPRPAPTILYVCGHGPALKNGVSYGNKVSYQHHGAWFASNGYVCLMIDTIELGEIQGVHHGTYRQGMWWWNSRGYTPAGVEAWNGMRALDYLESRPEVDRLRLGITGRSGGGAYSWWIAALDDRIKAAAPIAGITDLRNHVLDGSVEGHCDCMFMVNTYRWDYPLVAALVAPRPLLLGNSDSDWIFPLDGVYRLQEKVRKIYRLTGHPERFGLLITQGPHKDTQDLQLPVFRWFNKFLKQEDPVIEMAAKKIFQPEELKVFAQIPSDERTSKIQESFIQTASFRSPPESNATWITERTRWMKLLGEKSFRGWPSSRGLLHLKEVWSTTNAAGDFGIWEFHSQRNVPLRLYVHHERRANPARPITLRILNEKEWPGWAGAIRAKFPDFPAEEFPSAAPGSAAASAWLEGDRPDRVWFAPRGIGWDAWSGDAKEQIQLRRRFMLLGQTLEAMRVYDILRATEAVSELPLLANTPIQVEAHGDAGVDAVYAALFQPKISNLDLWEIPASHDHGPDYLNVLKFMDIPQAVAMVSEHRPCRIHSSIARDWEFPLTTAKAYGWKQPIELVP